MGSQEESQWGEQRAAQQGSYHPPARCDLLISPGLSSPLIQHPSIIPPLLLFQSRLLSPSVLLRFTQWKSEKGTNQRGAEGRREEQSGRDSQGKNKQGGEYFLSASVKLQQTLGRKTAP